MSKIKRDVIFRRLNAFAYKAIDDAFAGCEQRGNEYVELAHWIYELLQLQDSDVHRILQHFGIEAGTVMTDLVRMIEKTPKRVISNPQFSKHIERAIEEGWLYASLMHGQTQVRSGYLLLGIVENRELSQALLAASSQFALIKGPILAENFSDIVAGSPESKLQSGADPSLQTATGNEDSSSPSAEPGSTKTLSRYAVNLTERARKGEIDAYVGRDDEIRQVIDILMRRKQNNPILTGEAGVGKTAVVEGFAVRIASGDVPASLKDVSIFALDIGLLQAGAGVRGEFENRMRQIIQEVQGSTKPIILFIDEAHTLIGAGGQAGTGDAANLLKPALARGTLRTIAATTWGEYKKFIEPDPALARRFQVVQVLEPEEKKAIEMLRGVAISLERHHKVLILGEAIRSAVRLSQRYLLARQLPDKAVSLLDTACARVATSQQRQPAEVENCQRQIEALEAEHRMLTREQAVGAEFGAEIKAIDDHLETERIRLSELKSRWQAELALAERILALRQQLLPKEAGNETSVVDDNPLTSSTDAANPISGREELETLQKELKALQGESPLLLLTVDEEAVSAVVADWTGIPIRRMVRNELEAVLKLPDTLGQRVIGQRHALEMVARRIQTTRAGLDNPGKPIGVFMLCGPSGVGKTESALALAEALYGDEDKLVAFNMSEFQEEHSVATLKGAPPGYKGFEEGGVLTEAVRRRPYSVVLLDEIEKADPNVHELFYQVFDKGWMEDGQGSHIDFKNTVILLTSNVGSDVVMKMCENGDQLPTPEALAEALRRPLLAEFPAAFLGRVIIIPYYPLSDSMLSQIVKLQLGRIDQRLRDKHNVPLNYGEDVVRLIIERCTEVESGGRMIDSILSNTVLPRISQEILTRAMDGQKLSTVTLSVANSGFEYAFA